MKSIKKIAFILFAASLPALSVLQSCNNDEQDAWYNPALVANSVVTVKTASDKSQYLQLDENTTLRPVNIKGTLFDGKEVRALANLMETNDNAGNYTKAVYVNWIDSIRTKGTVLTLGSKEENDKAFGNDPFEIMKDWFTIAEDGYITLRIRTLWGTDAKHYINLVTGVNENNPYEVEMRQDSKGDEGKKIGDSLIAFYLGDLPDTNGKTVKLKIRWNSFSGEKSAEFDYCTRKASTKGTLSLSDTQYIQAVK